MGGRVSEGVVGWGSEEQPLRERGKGNSIGQ